MNNKKSVNPLLKSLTAALPLFSAIKPKHVKLAITKILQDHQCNVQKLLHNKTEFNWDNLLAPLEEIDDQLHQVWSIISHLNAVQNTPTWRQVYGEILPTISKYFTKLGQNKKLYQAIFSLKQSQNFKKLNSPQQKIINELLRDFHLSGVALSGIARQQFSKLKLNLDKLHNKFSNNVLDATYGWHYCAGIEELSGIPPNVLVTAKKNAKAKKQKGYLFSLDAPSYQAILSFADSRILREKFYTAYLTRASAQGPHDKKYDNSKIMENIIANRAELSHLLGFPNYAKLSLATKMVHNPQQAISFLEKLATYVHNKAQKELAELVSFAHDSCGIKDFKPWDIAYCSEKLRQQKLDLSEEELRPYFPAPHVLSGLFTIVQRLFKLKIKEINDFETWHQDVRLFAIYAANNELRGYFYVDLYVREYKRGGAWMDECRVRRRLIDGSIQAPIAYLNCNFTVPINDQPALLSHYEVVTLFHEFGHCLQHLLSKVDYAQASGINGVPLDAVEFPSQFMENWCWQKTTLKILSQHYQTGKTLPNNLILKLHQSKNFQIGMQVLRQIEFGLFDLKLHIANKTKTKNIDDIYKILSQVRKKIRIIPTAKFDRMPNSFEHIFGGGYAAGYYSYKWSEMMAADAFATFKARGIFDKDTSQAYLHNILEVGSSIDPCLAFKNYCGHEPDLKALLVEYK